jgi:hypothetical protein
MEEKQGDYLLLFEGSLLSRIVSNHDPARLMDLLGVFSRVLLLNHRV